MREETISYEYNGIKFKGFLAYDDSIQGKRPGILVAHTWKGVDDFVKNKARDLAKLGYVAFAADVFGNGVVAESDEEAEALIQPLFVDRSTLRGRIESAYKALIQFELVDADKVGAIGFCFGGLTVIELLRGGSPVKGVVSFHGVLGNKLGEMRAQVAPNAEKIRGAILILHGHDDPLVSQSDITDLENELTKAQVDWQMHIYGHAMHSFTNPVADDEKHGFRFNEKANKRSWQAMSNFFNEILK